MATNLLCEGSASGLSIDSAFQPDKEKNYIYMPIYNLKLDDPFMCWCSWLIFIIFGLSTAGLQILSNAHKALCSSYCYASRGCIPTRTRLHKIKDWHVHPQQLPTLLNCRPVEPRKNSYVVKLAILSPKRSWCPVHYVRKTRFQNRHRHTFDWRFAISVITWAHKFVTWAVFGLQGTWLVLMKHFPFVSYTFQTCYGHHVLSAVRIILTSSLPFIELCQLWR